MARAREHGGRLPSALSGWSLRTRLVVLVTSLVAVAPGGELGGALFTRLQQGLLDEVSGEIGDPFNGPAAS